MPRKVPSADPYLGLALCQAAARRLDEAQATLREAERVEPDNPVVLANLGIVLSDAGKFRDAIASFQRALTLDPNFHEARFNLARAYARAGQRQEAAREAQELLARLPPTPRSVRKCRDCWMQCGETPVETTTEVTEFAVFTTEDTENTETHGGPVAPRFARVVSRGSLTEERDCECNQIAFFCQRSS